MPLLNFTIDFTTNAAVVILGVCATMWYIAWTGLRRARIQRDACNVITPHGEGNSPNERHR